MCLFSIKFEGRKYSKAAALRLLQGQKQRIEELVTKVNYLENAKTQDDAKFAEEHKRRHHVECELGEARRQVRELKAQLSTANEELNDFPARAKSGKYVKRRKTAKPEVKPSNAE